MAPIGEAEGQVIGRVRNLTGEERRVTVEVYFDGEEEPSFAEQATLEAATEPPWPERSWQIADDVTRGTPYRVVVTVAGNTFETSDVADCVGRDGDSSTEWIEVTIESDDNVDVLPSNCSGT